METNTGFSTNTLINALRSLFDQSKDKFSCDHIQEVMNVITDLEYEVHLLQTNYSNIMKQNDQINDINQNLQEIFQRLAVNQLSPITEDVSSTTSQTNEVACGGGGCSGGAGVTAKSDDVRTMADLISDLVVRKLTDLESPDADADDADADADDAVDVAADADDAVDEVVADADEVVADAVDEVVAEADADVAVDDAVADADVAVDEVVPDADAVDAVDEVVAVVADDEVVVDAVDAVDEVVADADDVAVPDDQ